MPKPEEFVKGHDRTPTSSIAEQLLRTYIKESPMYTELRKQIHIETSLARPYETFYEQAALRVHARITAKLVDLVKDEERLFALLTSFRDIAGAEPKGGKLQQAFKNFGDFTKVNVIDKYNSNQDLQKLIIGRLFAMYLDEMTQRLINASQTGAKADVVSLDSSSPSDQLTKITQKSKEAQYKIAKEKWEKERDKAIKEGRPEPPAPKDPKGKRRTFEAVERNVLSHNGFALHVLLMDSFYQSISLDSEIQIIKPDKTPGTSKAPIRGASIKDSGLDKLSVTVPPELDLRKTLLNPKQVKDVLNTLILGTTGATEIPRLSKDLISPTIGMRGQARQKERPTQTEILVSQIASLPPILEVEKADGKNLTKVKTIHLVLGHIMTKSPGSVSTIAAIHDVAPSQDLIKDITLVYGKETAIKVFKILDKPAHKTVIRAMQAMAVKLVQQLQKADIQSGAGNILRDVKTWVLTYSLLASGLSTINAILQSLQALIQAFSTKKAGDLVSCLINYWFFSKMMKLSYSKLAGISIDLDSEGFVEQAIKKVFKMSQTPDIFTNDKAISKQTLLGFYQSYYSVKAGGTRILQDDNFIKFARAAFLDKSGKPYSPKNPSDPRIKKTDILEKAKAHKPPQKRAMTALITQLEKNTKPKSLSMVQFYFFSLALNANNIQDVEAFNKAIGLNIKPVPVKTTTGGTTKSTK